MGMRDDPNRPLWPTFENMPTDMWVIYYQGNSGRWLMGSNCYSLETAERMACLFDHPTKILRFNLAEEIDVDNNQLRKKYKRIVRQPKVITKVRMPKKG